MKKIDQIRMYILKHGSITKLEAAKIFFEFGLKGKINRLIEKGLKIETVMIERPGRQAYAKYKLIGGKV